MAFAVETKVPVMQTRNEIQALLEKREATSFAFMETSGMAIIAFEMTGRKIRFNLPLPEKPDRETNVEKNRREQRLRSLWRALLLCIRAKLESVEAGIETLEEAFLAHIQMPSGRTVYEEVREPIAIGYRNHSNVPLLPGPK